MNNLSNTIRRALLCSLPILITVGFIALSGCGLVSDVTNNGISTAEKEKVLRALGEGFTAYNQVSDSASSQPQAAATTASVRKPVQISSHDDAWNTTITNEHLEEQKESFNDGLQTYTGWSETAQNTLTGETRTSEFLFYRVISGNISIVDVYETSVFRNRFSFTGHLLWHYDFWFSRENFEDFYDISILEKGTATLTFESGMILTFTEMHQLSDVKKIDDVYTAYHSLHYTFELQFDVNDDGQPELFHGAFVAEARESGPAPIIGQLYNADGVLYGEIRINPDLSVDVMAAN